VKVLVQVQQKKLIHVRTVGKCGYAVCKSVWFTDANEQSAVIQYWISCGSLNSVTMNYLSHKQSVNYGDYLQSSVINYSRKIISWFSAVIEDANMLTFPW